MNQFFQFFRVVSLLIAGCAMPLSASTSVAASGLPMLPPEWTISNDDCVSVHADGDPWDECGFQAWNLDQTGTRILAVSTRGEVQLWNRKGEQITNVIWGNQKGGASGFPDAKAMFLGELAIAVVHQNQLLVLDKTTGQEKFRKSLNIMSIKDWRIFGTDQLIVRYKDDQWKTKHAELDLATGDLANLPEGYGLRRMTKSYWVTGSKAPFTMHFPDRDKPPLQLERSCIPIDEEYCRWIEGKIVYVFDIERRAWFGFDLSPHFRDPVWTTVVNTNGLLTVSARERGASQNEYNVFNMHDGSEIERHPSRKFETLNGSIFYDRAAKASVLADHSGVKKARLPFNQYACSRPHIADYRKCIFAQEGKLWLVPLYESNKETGAGFVVEVSQTTSLGFFELPASKTKLIGDANP